MPQRSMENIVENYGLRLAELRLVDVEVPRGQTKFLTTRPRDEHRGKLVEGVYKTLKPRSLADVKSWIGVPDKIARERRHPHVVGPIGPAAWRTTRIPRRIALPSPIDFRPARATIAEKRVLKEKAREYVLGDSERVSATTVNLIEKLYPAWEIYVVLVKNITVWTQSTLVIEKDVGSLLANTIKIYQGGQIISKGHLKIDCVSIQGNIPP